MLALFSCPLALAHDDDHDAIGKPIDCGSCAEWNKALAPFKVAGNTWYVGTGGLSAVLLTGPQGHILFDGALPQSAAQIKKNIATLGFKFGDVKYIVSSHPHWDHAGGIAELARDSGATVVATAPAAKVLRDGVIGSDDPQFDPAGNTHFGKVSRILTVGQGEVIALGPLKVTAHMTPGHTPGGASYSWQSCEGGRCLDVVYADSLNPVSSDGYYFSGDAKTPDIAPAFAASIARLGALKCDVIVSVHPGFSDLLDKLARTTPTRNAFIDPNGCKAYAASAAATLARRLDKEAADKAKAPH